MSHRMMDSSMRVCDWDRYRDPISPCSESEARERIRSACGRPQVRKLTPSWQPANIAVRQAELVDKVIMNVWGEVGRKWKETNEFVLYIYSCSRVY